MSRSGSPPTTAVSARAQRRAWLPARSFTRGDLMHLALMASENRAAHALGRNYPGGVAACVIAMNAKARELGMTSAHFVEPTGLSDENVASPEDLSKLVMAAAKVPADPRVLDRQRLRGAGRPAPGAASAIPTRWSASPTGTSSCRRPATSRRPGRCLVMQTVIEDRTIVIVLLNSFGKHTRVADATPHPPLDGSDSTPPAASATDGLRRRPRPPTCTRSLSGARLDAAQMPRGGDPGAEPAEQRARRRAGRRCPRA